MTTPTIADLYGQLGDMMGSWQLYLDQQITWQAGPNAANDTSPPDNNPALKGFRVLTDSAGNPRTIMTLSQMEALIADASSSAVAAGDAATRTAQYAQGSMLDGGNVDLSGGVYPAPLKNSLDENMPAFWKVTVAGKVGNIDYAVGDTLIYSAKAASFTRVNSPDQHVLSGTAPAIKFLETDTGKVYWMVADGSGIKITENTTAGPVVWSYASASNALTAQKFTMTAAQGTGAGDAVRYDYTANQIPNRSGSISGSINLDTYQTPGFYYQAADAGAASGTNYPTPLAGTLLVFKHAGVAQIYITYKTDGTRKLYWRNFYSSVWSSWSQIFTEVSPPTPVQVGAQPVDATLTALAGVTTAADTLTYFTGVDVAASTPLTPFARTLLDDTTAPAALTTLGAQPVDATLTALAGVATAADKLLYFTGVDVATSTAFTPFARTLLDDVDAPTALVTLGALAATANAVSASKWATARSITLTGDVTGTVSIDGTANVSLATTYKNSGVTAGTYKSVTVDARGVVTAGTNPTTLTGYGITDAQPLDATLTTIAGLTTAADTLAYFSGVDVATTTPLTSFARTLLDDADAAAARTTLGAQPLDATLTALAGVVTSADKILYFNGVDTAAATPLTSFARTLLDDVDAATMRTTIGAQASDATLTAMAGVVTAADKLIYFNGVDTATSTALTAFGRSLIDDADAAAALTTLGALPATANAVSASKWATARTITLDGDVTGSIAIDGSGDVTLTATVVDDSHAHLIADVDNLQTTLDGKQPLDATLTALAGVTTAADKILYFNGVDTATSATLTAFGRSLIDDADATTARTTLGAQATITGAATTIATANLTASKVVTSDASGKISTSSVSTTEVGYLAGVTSAIQTQLGTKEATANKNAVNGYAGLDASGKIFASQLPALAITDTFVVADQTAMLALTAEVGDVAVRTDLSTSFILKTAGASTLANWQELLTPTDLVSSVNGMTGAVTVSTITGNAGTATKLATARTISFTGDSTGSASFDGSANISIALTGKLSGVTAGTYKSVTVDALGYVTAGTNPTTLAGYGITDALGISANAVSATKLATGRTISATGDATGVTAAFDGSANVSMALTLANSGVTAGTYPKVTVDAKGRVTAGAAMVAADIPALDWAKITTGKPTTLAGYGITDALGIAGNAVSASKLETARTIATTGDATGSVSFDGSADASIALTLANSGATAGTYPKVTVDAKGRVTAGSAMVAADIPALDWAKITTGKPTTLAGYGITDAVGSTGNAASATKLATARTLTIGSTGKTFDGTANVSWTLAEIGAYAAAGGAIAGDFWRQIAAANGSNPIQAGSVTYLGVATDTKPSLVLLCEKYVDVALPKTGFSGRIHFTRGTSAWAPYYHYVDLAVISSNTTNTVRMIRKHSIPGAKIVETTYNSKTYYALTIGSASNSSVFAEGIIFGSTPPLLIPDATAYTTTDVATTEEEYHTGNKPTPTDIGAVNKAGDTTITGALAMSGNGVSGENPFLHGFKTFNGVNGNQYGMGILEPAGGNTNWGANIFGPNYANRYIYFSKINSATPTLSTHFSVKAKIALDTGEMYLKDGTSQVFHKGFLPTAAEVGALAVAANAVSASKLATARTLSITGDATGSVSFDGTADAPIALTLADSGVTAGTYPKVTVDSKGRVTAGSAMVAADVPDLDWSKITTGKPTTLAGYGITNGQPLDATLTALAGVTTAADKILYFTGVDTATSATLTSFARTLLDDVDAATMRTTIGAQASDATLTSMAGVTTAADKMIYFTGVDVASAATLTAFARTLLDDTDAATARATLGAASSAHVGAGGTEHALATTSTDGFMSAADKTYLDALVQTGNSYTHPVSGVTAGTYKSVTVNAEGHVTAGTNPTTLAGYGITDAVSLAGNVTLTGNLTAPKFTMNTAQGTAAGDAVRYDYLANGIPVRGTKIPGSTDLNTYTTPGFYYQSMTADAATGTNYPVGIAGSLEVIYGNASGVVQRYTTYNTGIVYVRGCTSGLVWGAWYKQYGENSKPTLVELGAQATITGAATTIATANLTASKVVTSDASGKISTSSVSTTEVGYLAGVTSAIQTQLNGKQATIAYTTENAANKNAVNGYAGLDASGKIAASQLPAIAITDTFVVADQTAMLALTAEVGDVAVRTDLSKSFILKMAGASTLANWQELLTPTDLVSSVNGMTGAVSVTTITGNAGTATKLATGRTISATGDATGTSAAFDGSANASIALTLANSGATAGTYPKVTVDAKGRVTAGAALAATDIPVLDWTKITTGKPTTLAGYGITNALPIAGGTGVGALTFADSQTSIILNTPAGNAGYIRGRVAGADNWYVGRGSADNTLHLYSNAMGHGLVITTDRSTFTKFVSAPDFYVTSDVRLKSNFAPITNALGKIKQLAGKLYDKDGQREAGLIAQDVLAVQPESVREDKDGFLSIANAGIAALIIEAIKELDAKVEVLINGHI